MKITITSKQCDDLINKYLEIEGSTVINTNEGCLTSGDWILTAPFKKTTIINRKQVN